MKKILSSGWRQSKLICYHWKLTETSQAVANWWDLSNCAANIDRTFAYHCSTLIFSDNNSISALLSALHLVEKVSQGHFWCDNKTACANFFASQNQQNWFFHVPKWLNEIRISNYRNKYEKETRKPHQAYIK